MAYIYIIYNIFDKYPRIIKYTMYLKYKWS
uniref:Uncharacterized protein n=1 Tax=viral metagenome TaxID=1070528 RepID=A0A6C0BR63_9ZZZZ